MSGRETPPKSDLPISRHLSPLQQVRTRSRKEDHGEPCERVKKAKLRNLNPVLQQQEGIATSITIITKEKKNEDLGLHNEEKGTSQQIEATSMGLSDRLEHYFPMNHNSLKADSITLTLGLDEKFMSHPSKDAMEINSNTTDLAARAVDLNEPFYPYKMSGQVRSREPSECGSTTSSVENKMKQNGFAYNFQGKAPIPKPWRCQQTKKKDEEVKKNTDMTKQEQANRCTKIAASGQLLCGLNPGIIKHVRNSKQVNSIIKAMLQNEKLEKQEVHRPSGQLTRSKEAINLWKQQRNSLAVDNLDLSLNKSFCHHLAYREQVGDLDMLRYKSNHENYHTSEFLSECEDDAVTLKLASSVTKTSEHASSKSNAGFSKNWEDITYLSFKAAKVASQWLEFLRHDIELRLATLRRSKMRVKNVIQVELPYLISRDCPPNKENEAPFAQWKALFNQMELSLSVEGKQLEKWLGQVEELLSQCEKGLGYVSANRLSHLDLISNLRVLKSREAWEREFAVWAAAASIYSTCSMIMTAENVPCF